MDGRGCGTEDAKDGEKDSGWLSRVGESVGGGRRDWRLGGWVAVAAGLKDENGEGTRKVRRLSLPSACFN